MQLTHQLLAHTLCSGISTLNRSPILTRSSRKFQHPKVRRRWRSLSIGHASSEKIVQRYLPDCTLTCALHSWDRTYLCPFTALTTAILRNRRQMPPLLKSMTVKDTKPRTSTRLLMMSVPHLRFHLLQCSSTTYALRQSLSHPTPPTYRVEAVCRPLHHHFPAQYVASSRHSRAVMSAGTQSPSQIAYNLRNV